MPPSRPLAERFWEKVDRRGPDECWPWTAGTNNSRGYGKIASGPGIIPRALLSHRAAYELQVGPVPEGQCVLHECDNPPCCNPRHLFLGTRQDNVEDMVNKGRQRGASGESNARSKLTPYKVEEIRRTYIKGSPVFGAAAQARKHGVTPTAIRHIIRGVNWA